MLRLTCRLNWRGTRNVNMEDMGDKDAGSPPFSSKFFFQSGNVAIAFSSKLSTDAFDCELFFWSTFWRADPKESKPLSFKSDLNQDGSCS